MSLMCFCCTYRILCPTREVLSLQIELTNKQYRRLLDLVYIGNWVLNATRGDDRIQEYDERQTVERGNAYKISFWVGIVYYLVVVTLDEVEYWVQNFNSITVTEYTRSFRAPVAAGEVMGTLTYYPEDGGSAVVYEMLAGRSIAAREQLFPSIDQIIEAAENDKNPFPRVTFELVFLHVILPAVGIWMLVKIIKFLKKHIRRRRRATGTHGLRLTVGESQY